MSIMTRLVRIVCVVLPLAILVSACEPRKGTDGVKDKVNDALDRRPNEKIRDAAEDVRDGVKDAVKDVKEAATPK